MYVVSARDDGTTRIRAQLRVRLFGEALVTYYDEISSDVPIPSRCMLLLAHLVLHPKTRLRERIAAALWPDVADSEARANLRRILHELIRSLPKASEPWILCDSQHIYWNSRAPLWCDVDTFDRLIGAERTHADALDLYAGDLLVGEDSEWVATLRESLRDRQLEALHAFADAALARGDTAAAARAFRRLLDVDPFREDAMRALLGIRIARHDRARAISEYKAFTTKLAAELGVAPMPETIACYERVFLGLLPERPATAPLSARDGRERERQFAGALAR